ncbi:MAG: amidohydrolase family protein, partial [Congregibacter sp.]|nr:amidohydrolase family protein [Congregibacter sp.]
MSFFQTIRRYLCIGLGAVLSLPGVAAPDLIFFGGPVITMDGDDRIAQALAVEDGRIVAVGALDTVLALADAGTRRVDLKGAPLLPGFVDSHSHVNFIGIQAMSANLLPPPDGEGASVAAIQGILRDYLTSQPGLQREIGWVIGFGYDDSQLAEQRHPTRQEMDAVSVDVPILLIHQSGHLGVANSRGLQMAGVTADTPDPEGGAFRRESDGKQPNGVAEENAFFRLIFTALAGADDALQDRMTLAGAASMASFGYTTAQEGRANPQGMASLQRVADRGELEIDVVSYPDMLM